MLTPEGTAGDAARSGPWTRWAWSAGVAGTGRRSGDRAGNAMDPGFHGVRTVAGRLWDAVNPGFHGVRTPWIRGFMTFQLAGRTRTMRLTVPVWPESGFRKRHPAAVMSYAAGATPAAAKHFH